MKNSLTYNTLIASGLEDNKSIPRERPRWRDGLTRKQIVAPIKVPRESTSRYS